MTNKEEIFDLIQKHPEGVDDDDISKMTGIEPRQQVQQICNQLASVKRIRRESVEKGGKRGKIQNFPSAGEDFQAVITAGPGKLEKLRRRASAPAGGDG